MSEVIKVKILHRPLKAKWYEMQERGEKTEEYRRGNAKAVANSSLFAFFVLNTN